MKYNWEYEMSNITVTDFKLSIVTDSGERMSLTNDDVEHMRVELSVEEERSPYDPMVIPTSFIVREEQWAMTIALKRHPIVIAEARRAMGV